jgi:putative membrane protein
MIRGYTEHAANERTFLAWVRTGIAVIAFGFVIEKFNLFVLAMASAGTTAPDAARRLQLERMSGPLGRYDGLALILVGLALVVVAAVRFVRTGRMLDDQREHAASSVRTELIFSAVLALLVAGFSTYLVLGR